MAADQPDVQDLSCACSPGGPGFKISNFWRHTVGDPPPSYHLVLISIFIALCSSLRSSRAALLSAPAAKKRPTAITAPESRKPAVELGPWPCRERTSTPSRSREKSCPRGSINSVGVRTIHGQPRRWTLPMSAACKVSPASMCMSHLARSPTCHCTTWTTTVAIHAYIWYEHRLSKALIKSIVQERIDLPSHKDLAQAHCLGCLGSQQQKGGCYHGRQHRHHVLPVANDDTYASASARARQATSRLLSMTWHDQPDT